MTALATLVAFGAVIAITSEVVRYQQNGEIALKDHKIRQLEQELEIVRREFLQSLPDHWDTEDNR